MRKVLDAAEAGFDRVLKGINYLNDVAGRTKINPIRHEHFGAARPASALIGVNGLAIPTMNVEVEAVVAL